MSQNIEVFLPCRNGSKRAPKKNTRPFSAAGESLLEVKLGQLLATENVSRITLSTDDDEAASQAQRLSSSINVLERPAHLAADDTLISDLTKYAGAVVEAEYTLWTHVTSPLFGSASYTRLFNFLDSNLKEDLSLVAVRRKNAYLFTSQRVPLYDVGEGGVYWPPTQSLDPVFEVNNAAFLVPTSRLATGERTTPSWQFFECNEMESIDVDTEEDWQLAVAAFSKFQ
jgi:CMP-N-acetylneuraminic acid synthetase